MSWAVLPDSSGDVFLEPASVKQTNDVFDRWIMIFNDTSTKIGFAGGFFVPKNYNTSAKIYPIWTSTATSGNVVWTFDYRTVGGDDTTSLDQSGTEESASVTDAAPTAANRRLEPSISLTSANFAADEQVSFHLYRDGTSGSDTMAAAAQLWELIFEYSD